MAKTEKTDVVLFGGEKLEVELSLIDDMQARVAMM